MSEKTVVFISSVCSAATAVDAVRAGKGQVRHADPAIAASSIISEMAEIAASSIAGLVRLAQHAAVDSHR